jgi:hypothetical protein
MWPACDSTNFLSKNNVHDPLLSGKKLPTFNLYDCELAGGFPTLINATLSGVHHAYD